MFYSLALSLNVSLWRPWGVSGVVLHPLFIGPLVLTLNTAAYTAEIFYGALRAVPRGEIEAARAYGMNRVQQFRHVVWPNLIRLAWPAYTNEVVFLFHATAIVYFALPVIGTQRDLMITAKDLFERDYNAFLHFSVAALYFLAVSLVLFFLSGSSGVADPPSPAPAGTALRTPLAALNRGKLRRPRAAWSGGPWRRDAAHG